MEEIFAEMERQGRETVGRGQTLAGVEVRRSADMRYVGQEHAVTVELPIDLFTSQDRDGIKKLFDAVHQTRYGFSVAGEKAEIVSLRSAVTGRLRKPPAECIEAGRETPLEQADAGRRPVIGRRLDEPGTGEIHRALAAERRRLRLRASFGDMLERRLSHFANHGAAQAHDLGLFAGHRKSVARLVYGVE